MLRKPVTDVLARLRLGLGDDWTMERIGRDCRMMIEKTDEDDDLDELTLVYQDFDRTRNAAVDFYQLVHALALSEACPPGLRHILETNQKVAHMADVLGLPRIGAAA